MRLVQIKTSGLTTLQAENAVSPVSDLQIRSGKLDDRQDAELAE